MFFKKPQIKITIVKKVGTFAVFSLIVLMVFPAYADVDKAEIDVETFTINDKFTISGTVSDAEKIMLVASMKGPSGEKLTKNIMSDPGTFSFIAVDAKLLFDSDGEYTINVFTEKQLVANGTLIKLIYDNGVISLLPDYIIFYSKYYRFYN